jgi:hypothetical protein
MKILLGILAILLLAASLFADYKWRKWIAARSRRAPTAWPPPGWITENPKP